MLARSLFFSKVVLLVVIVGLSSSIYGVNDWIWLGGDGAKNVATVYPETPGLPGQPGSRQQAACWTDNTGNLWLFGGQGIATAGGGRTAMADLWKFEPVNQNWTWVGGSKSPNPSPVYPDGYGQAGTPGGRYACTTWKDTAGNLWMFGGFGGIGSSSGYLGDLWKYNIQTNVWTFEAGVKTLNDAGNYAGGVGNPGRPGARMGSAASVTKNGDFLLFGGGISNARMNDLWRFSPSNPTVWTWLGGSSNTDDKGTLPLSHGSSGWPGARVDAGCFTDEFGHFYIFGGFGYGNSVGQRNDIWSYNPDTNVFLFISGSHQSVSTTYPDSYDQVGTMGGRNQMQHWYVAGKLYVSGGYGPGPIGYERCSDLWTYTLADGLWRWIDGPKGQASGVFPAAAGGKGLPVGRQSGICWTRNNYQIYLLGGTTEGSTASRDFWRRDVAISSDVADWQLY